MHSYRGLLTGEIQVVHVMGMKYCIVMICRMGEVKKMLDMLKKHKVQGDKKTGTGIQEAGEEEGDGEEGDGSEGERTGEDTPPPSKEKENIKEEDHPPLKTGQVFQLIDILTDNLPRQFKANPDTCHGISYQSKAGKAHVHALVCLQPDEGEVIPENTYITAQRLKKYLGVGDYQVTYQSGKMIYKKNKCTHRCRIHLHVQEPWKRKWTRGQPRPSRKWVKRQLW